MWRECTQPLRELLALQMKEPDTKHPLTVTELQSGTLAEAGLHPNSPPTGPLIIQPPLPQWISPVFTQLALKLAYRRCPMQPPLASFAF